jgi:hypothetical protein
MQTLNRPYHFLPVVALGVILSWLSLPAYSDENTGQIAEPQSMDAESGPASVPPTEETPAAEPQSMEPEPDTASAPSDEATSDEATSGESTTTTPPKSEHVLRALLTTGIENREPVDEIVSLDKNSDRVYFFTEFSGLKGKMVKHRWEYNGKVMGEVNFNIGSNHWRCYSSKNLLPEWTGIWTVSVIDDQDNVLAETYFEVTE